MGKLNLPYVQHFRDRYRHARYYLRKPGCKRIALPGPPGSPEFMAAYQAGLMTQAVVGADQVKVGSMAALIVSYYQSAEFDLLQPETRRTTRRILDAFREKYGELPASRFEAKHLRAILDSKSGKPWAAKNLLKRLRSVFRCAVDRGLVHQDPTIGVRVAAPKTDGFRAWTDSDISKFEERWPAGSRARLALYLLLYTGQRRGDVVTMGRQHLDGSAIQVRQKKTGTLLWIPLHPRLEAELGRWPGDNLTFLMTEQGRPFSPVGFSNWFTGCARQAGLPHASSPHGLRKAAARRLAEAGCTILQIAAITGHASLKEVERYTKSAQQKQLAEAAIRALGST